MGTTTTVRQQQPPSRQKLRDVPLSWLSLPRSQSAPKRDWASVIRMPLQRRRRRQSLLLLLLVLLLLFVTLSCCGVLVSASSEPLEDGDDVNAGASDEKAAASSEGPTDTSTMTDAPLESLSDSKREWPVASESSPKLGETSLLLVHRDSPYALRLEAVTAYRLRQSQQQYNNENEVEMDVHGNIVQTFLPKVKRGTEMESTGKTLKKPSTNEPSSTNQTQTTQALAVKSKDGKLGGLHDTSDSDVFETIPLRLAGDHVDMAIAFRDATFHLNGTQKGGFMILGVGTRDLYANVGVGRYNESDEDGMDSTVVSVRLWPELLSKPKPASKKEQALQECLARQRQFLLQTRQGQVLFAETIRAGAPVWLTPHSLADEHDWCQQVKKGTTTNESIQQWQFIVNSDGTISPASAVQQNLVIGLAPHPEVTLVRRNRRNRHPQRQGHDNDCNNEKVLLFDSLQTLWLQKPAPVHGTPMMLSKMSTSETTNNPPPLAMVPLYSFDDGTGRRSSSSSSYDAFGFWDVQRLGVGPPSSSRDSTSSIIHLHALDNGKRFEFVLHDNDGRMLVPFNLHLEDGVPVRLVKYNVSTILHDDLGPILDTMVFAWSGNATWVINDDQSISPLNAPYLALGLSMGIGGGECKEGQSSTSKPATTGASEGSDPTAAATASQDRRRAEQLERLFATGTIPRQENIHSDHYKFANETYQKPVQNSRAMALFVDYILDPQMLWSIHSLLASCGNATTTSSDSGSSSGIGMSSSISGTMDSFAYILHAVLWSASLMGVVLTLLVIKRIPWMIWGIPIVWIWMGSNVSIVYNCGVIVVFCSTMYKRWKQRRDRGVHGPNQGAVAAAAAAAANAQAAAPPPPPPPPPAAAPVDDNEVDLRLLE